MPKHSMGDQPIQGDAQIALEQARLEALLQITTEHSKEIHSLQSQLDAAEKKSSKLDAQTKILEQELKVHRAINPDRMKKQIKRLQEQNREVTLENNMFKSKQKQLQQQHQQSKNELEKLKEEQKLASEKAEKAEIKPKKIEAKDKPKPKAKTTKAKSPSTPKSPETKAVEVKSEKKAVKKKPAKKAKAKDEAIMA